MKKHVIKLSCIAFLLLGLSIGTFAQTYTIYSPDKSIQLIVHTKDFVAFDVVFKGKTIIKGSRVAMQIKGKQQLGISPKVTKKVLRANDSFIEPVVPTKSAKIHDVFNELLLTFRGNYQLAFRVYNDGVAYRFSTGFKGEVVVESETFHLSFAEETTALFPEEKSLVSHYERYYLPTQLDTLKFTHFCSLPVLLTVENVRVLLTEADVYDYPCLFMQGTEGQALDSKFPPFVKTAEPIPGREDRNQVLTYEDYIAKTKGKRGFPWRVLVITDDDAKLVESNLVFQLSSPIQIEETNWIKPGKVAWDWYNANNVYGVDFKASINTETYKYYIDFAAKFGLEYIILDEGWSLSTLDIDRACADIDIVELVRYGKEKNVGIILWVLWGPLDQNIDVLETYNSWGVKGIKIDFMQRADQYMVNYYERVAKKAAENQLLVDYHGSFKPAGLRRAYPNVLSYEGVKGNENNKWSQGITPSHNLTLPFIRMVAGPMDYTPGAMQNANLVNHSISFMRPMSIGTRCHQLAMYVVFESPLQMLCDAPSHYLKEEKLPSFIAQIPSTWDKTNVLEAKVGEYILIARKKSDQWFIGAMTANEKDFEVDFSFLDDGQYKLEFVQDGKNADRYAEDYKFGSEIISPDSKLNIKLAKGGGWAGIITSIEE